MQHRLYFLMPDVSSARRVMNDLLLARITERHIHFVSSPASISPACTKPTSSRPPTSSMPPRTGW